MLDPLNRFDELPQLHASVVESFCELAKQTIADQGRFSVSLSGGSTPKRIYELLREQDLPWDGIHWFWGDERNVPHDHTDSNCRMVHEALLNHVPVPKENIHPVPVNVADPKAAAESYEATLRSHFAEDSFPRWDLALLGMGDDAHTASLFPGTVALSENTRWFVENWVEKFDAFRYTMTAPAINSAERIWFLVSGSNKQDAIANVFSNQDKPNEYPSQLIQEAKWYITNDAIA